MSCIATLENEEALRGVTVDLEFRPMGRGGYVATASLYDESESVYLGLQPNQEDNVPRVELLEALEHALITAAENLLESLTTSRRRIHIATETAEDLLDDLDDFENGGGA